VCPNDYCTFGEGGYAFALADSKNTPPDVPGQSTAVLAADGSLCIDGHLMQLPQAPTAADYQNDWGCGLGINLNQSMTGNSTGTFMLTGTGITVNTTAIPPCTSARVWLAASTVDPGFCAPLTPGVEIPWSDFNTACWDGSGTTLSGPPTIQGIRILFVTGFTACDFTNFCLTDLQL
jgi:hypothetical protein